jgi:hypothetical protein
MTFQLKHIVARRTLGLFSLLLVAALLGSLSGTALAAGPTPQQLPQRPDQSPVLDSTSSTSATATTLVLPPLKAVVAVGDIDGPTGYETLSAIENMKPAVTELIARGVSVQTFYPPNDNWSAIKTAANGAQFFYYGGHGLNDGNNNFGGMWFTTGASPNDHYISPTEIITNLKLAPNAIVMLFACWTAGSGTEDNITSAEALHRVSQYSQAFFTIGAAGYYSNWNRTSFQTFTSNLFNGMTLGNAFKNYGDYNAATTEIYTHPNFANRVLWLDKDYFSYGPGYAAGNKYDNAFGGFPNVTLQDLFATDMVARPSPILKLAAIGSPAAVTKVTVSSTSQATFNWTASLAVSGSWATISGTSGVSGSQTTVTLTPSGLPKGTYKGTLHVHATTSGVITPDQDIPVQLVVADNIYKTYLPNTIR